MTTFPTRPRVRSGRRALFALAAVGASLLGGCASLESALAPPSLEAGRQSDTSPGVAVDAAFLEKNGLRVIGTYSAASGRECRRLAALDGTAISRTSCRGADGVWRLGRSLGRSTPVSPAGRETTRTDTVLVPAPLDTVQGSVDRELL